MVGKNCRMALNAVDIICGVCFIFEARATQVAQDSFDSFELELCGYSYIILCCIVWSTLDLPISSSSAEEQEMSTSSVVWSAFNIGALCLGPIVKFFSQWLCSLVFGLVYDYVQVNILLILRDGKM